MEVIIIIQGVYPDLFGVLMVIYPAVYHIGLLPILDAISHHFSIPIGHSGDIEPIVLIGSPHYGILVHHISITAGNVSNIGPSAL